MVKHRGVVIGRQGNFMGCSPPCGAVLNPIVVVDFVAEGIEGILPGLDGVEHRQRLTSFDRRGRKHGLLANELFQQ